MLSSAVSPGSSPLRVGLAWAVHGFTASGAVLAVLALLATAGGDYRRAALLMLAALFIDAVDGSLARAARVSEVLPRFDGRRLDDLVDYLNYVIVPAVFLVASGAVTSWGWAALPVLASAYGFSQVDAKTEDHFFLGFPSYWNVVAIYLWGLEVSPVVGNAIVALLSAAVFVPLKYVYPSRMTELRKTTNLGGAVWLALTALAVGFRDRLGGVPLLELTLAYPAYYLGVSMWLGGLHRRDP